MTKETEASPDLLLGVSLILLGLSANRSALEETISRDGHIDWPMSILAVQSVVIAIGLWSSYRGVPGSSLFAV